MENFEGFEEKRALTEAVTDAHCPACGASIQFDPATGLLKCEYCGYEAQIEPEKEGVLEELDFYTAEQTANRDWGAQKKSVVCESCGAQMIYDTLQNSQICPYCGSNHVMEQEVMDTMTPGGVIPFAIARQKASELFSRWLKKRWFVSNRAKRESKTDAFQGVYLPYWTFDTNTFSKYRGRYGIDHTEVRDGKTTTTTTWHNCSGKYDEFIDDHLIPASTTQNDQILRGVEPFSTSQSVAYKPEYVAGFVSERYQIGLKDGWEKARGEIDRRLKRAIESKIRKENHADKSEVTQVDTAYNDITYKYLLLPLWICAFRYNNKVYRFMVNGQTGKVAGKFPVSPLRVAIAVIIGIALVCLFALLSQNS